MGRAAPLALNADMSASNGLGLDVYGSCLEGEKTSEKQQIVSPEHETPGIVSFLDVLGSRVLNPRLSTAFSVRRYIRYPSEMAVAIRFLGAPRYNAEVA